jgi:hypothetical protein
MASPHRWVMFCDSTGLQEKVRDSVVIELYIKPPSWRGNHSVFQVSDHLSALSILSFSPGCVVCEPPSA